MIGTKVIAITGGIGSGKSVIAEMLRVMGHTVYDCDSRAKAIMDCDEAIKRAIAQRVCAEAIDKRGCIDRKRLAEEVFTDVSKLKQLNAIVHRAVIEDIARKVAEHPADKLFFIETAILFESGLDRYVDEIIRVVATNRTRVLRVMRRNNLSEAEVMSRINSQSGETNQPTSIPTTVIDNDGDLAVIPQLLTFLRNQV